MNAELLQERVDGSPIESPLFAPGSTLVFNSDKAIVALCTGGKIDLLRKTGSGADSQFQVDSSIKSQDLSFLHGRTLETISNAWLPSETNTDLQSVSTGGWDQFEVNRTKFGVKSTFDENLYTKRIDYSSMTAEQIAKAERIAREIEGTVSSNIHFQEERGQAMEQELDEEDRFSGVRRVPVGSPPTENVSPTPQDNVNPWSRGLKFTGVNQQAVRPPPMIVTKSKQQSAGNRSHAAVAEGKNAPVKSSPAPVPQAAPSTLPSVPASENELQRVVAEEPSSPLLAAPGLKVIPNIDNRSTSFSPEGETAESDPSDLRTVPSSAPNSQVTGVELTAEAVGNIEIKVADSVSSVDSAPAAPEEPRAEANLASNSEEAPSKLNPNAKEFKFNPNAKEFTLPATANFQAGALNQFNKPPPQQSMQMVQQQQAMRLGYNLLPGDVIFDANGNVLNNPQQLGGQWVTPAPGPGGAMPFDAQRMNMLPAGGHMFQPNQFFQQPNGEYVMMQHVPMQLPMEYGGML